MGTYPSGSQNRQRAVMFAVFVSAKPRRVVTVQESLTYQIVSSVNELMIEDLLKSAKETIAERLASPLLGAFGLAWCLWNYKFLVILFSSASVLQTFKLIENIAFPDTSSVFLKGILYPLASALVYVFAYPYPARFVYGFTLKRQREINQIKRQIEEETLLTLEQSRGIRAEYVQIERKHQEEADRLNAEVSRLKAAIDQTQKEPISSPGITMAENVYGNLEASQLALLQLIETREGEATLGDLIKTSEEPKVKTEFDLGELESRELVHKEYSQERHDYTFQFTHEGRRVLLKHGRLGD